MWQTVTVATLSHPTPRSADHAQALPSGGPAKGRLRGGLSLQARITAAAMGTSVCVLMVACVLFTLEQWSGDRARVISSQNHAAAVLAPRLARAHGRRDLIADALSDSSIATRLRRARVFDGEGRVLAAFDERDGAGTARDPGVTTSTALVDHGVNVGRLELESRLEPLATFLPRYVALIGALFFSAMGCSLFLGRMLARRVIEPVARLSEAMGEVAVSGDLGRRVEAAEDDEFGRLIESFNTLLDRLYANDRELRTAMTELVTARDQAEAANLQKSQFLANMSHEIRTPLNGVLAMAQIIALGELAAEQRARLDVIRSSGQSLLTILNDILDVSKIEAGALVLEATPFDLEPMVRSAAESFSAVAEGKGVELWIDIEPGAEGVRLGDPARLRQIIGNLVSNALKFTQVGTVAVRVETLEGSEGVRLTVTDTGIGMAADKLSLLFQKFTQLDSSTTRRFGGTGLGLSICHELTTLMGGRIWAESVEGRGSSFFVELPLERPAPAAAAGADGEVAQVEEHRPLRILAAEDNKTNQLVLSTILDIFGADVTIVDNGRLAVEAARSSPFDVILMDIQMPEMDGLAATRAIRAEEVRTGRPRTPILAVSANVMDHQVAEYLAAGMDGHVAKPIEISHLQTALERILAEPADEAAPKVQSA